jgi:hypothetical protein
MATETIGDYVQTAGCDGEGNQETGERFCTAVPFSIDFAAGSVLASLHECWIACGLTIKQESDLFSSSYLHFLLFCYSHFAPFSVLLHSWRDNIEMDLI